jgi:hypothetical protein
MVFSLSSLDIGFFVTVHVAKLSPWGGGGVEPSKVEKKFLKSFCNMGYFPQIIHFTRTWQILSGNLTCMIE